MCVRRAKADAEGAGGLELSLKKEKPRKTNSRKAANEKKRKSKTGTLANFINKNNLEILYKSKMPYALWHIIIYI